MRLDVVGTHTKPVAVITGAGGGVGQATARRLGLRYRLVIAARRAEQIASLHESLVAEGYDVALATTTDVTDPASLIGLATSAAAVGPIGAVVHTAGVSPAIADWRSILDVNLRGTAYLLDAFLPEARAGTVLVAVSSSAAHTLATTPEVDAILADPYPDELGDRLEPLLRELDPLKTEQSFTTRVYGASKRGVNRLVECRVGPWAAKGARIVTISPGTVVTPMIHKEIEFNPLAVRAAEFTPMRRFGSPVDMAAAIDFLTSDQAGYITGCDLRVDGGMVAARLHA
ncbi:MAG: SDR family oxidoreductase [Nocardioides sp.]|uniref:SDR family oxidoreductase n=1 Tax=Nocardioides sp. TaxID=35761 RepID=UPI0039E48D16